MPKTKDQGRDEVVRLCQYFATNRQSFLAPGVKEAHIRQNLIDPLFEALGWDVRNQSQAAPQYREVVPEDSIDVEGKQKAPDYAFRVGPVPKFYAEAKRCGANLFKDPAPAFQLRRYGWNARVACSILTSFEELGVYDCTLRPRPTEKASRGRLHFYRCEEYPDRWDELWELFSREAVWSGAFDQYAASRRKRGGSEVDVEFLQEIESWRESLARNIALRNNDISVDDLNAAVQRTIDRVVFMRMAEDRGLEPNEQLLKLCAKPDVYSRFMRDLCRRADEKYNSGLFHFQKEPGVSELPDRMTPRLIVDDKVFKPIIENLYFAHGSPYHFGVLPVEILGTVYERFLGKVIRLTVGHQAKVEEKPEVRKAGGVYYTPAYIVDYIVTQTVARAIDGKSPAWLSGVKGRSPFRVLDLACGSGSFLLGAYQCLMHHYLKWYVEHQPASHKKAVYKAPRSGEWRLTIDEKKRILTTHLFGVDIDAQAVEVSKLSLLLKSLEGENAATLALQLKLFEDRALPNLADNIQCGNSLIGPDYFLGRLIPDADEIKRVNPFEWESAFSNAMQAGGFDCIIGNPPYGALFGNTARQYLERNCIAFGATPDAYIAFIERAHNLLRRGGRFGYIIPSAWLGGPAYLRFRKYLLGFSIESLVLLPFDVFKDAFIDTVVVTTRNSPPSGKHAITTYEFGKKEKLSSINLESVATQAIPQRDLADNDDHKFALNAGISSLLTRLRRSTALRMSDAAGIKRGVRFDERLLTEGKASDNSYLYFEGDVYRYQMNWNALRWVEYGAEMQEFPKEFHWFVGERILLRRLVNRKQRLMAAWTDRTVITNKNLYVLKPTRVEAWQYLLAILNSRLVSCLYVSQVSGATKDDFPQVTIADLKSMPYRSIEFANKHDKFAHDRIVSLVDAMLTIQAQCASSKSEAEQSILQRQIDATDAEIDRLVYALYGLTAEEIAIVEAEPQAR